MNKLYITYILLAFSLLLASCSSEGEFTPSVPELPDLTWEEEEVDGPSAVISPFTPGDELTRSSLVYQSQKLVFGWNVGDKSGVYPTAKKLSDGDSSTEGLLNPTQSDGNKHPYYASDNSYWRTDPDGLNQRGFVCYEPTNTQTARLWHKDPEFVWDEVSQWTAYFPYKDINTTLTKDNPNYEDYEKITFSFENQKQEGLVDISAYRKGKEGQPAGESNPYYIDSERQASQHLGVVDFLISPETAWNGSSITFQLRHVGSVIRVYLKAPEKNLVITQLDLICDKKIFYEKGTVTLKSHPYKEKSNQEPDYGVSLSGGDSQISPVGDPTNKLTLMFYDQEGRTQAFSQYDPADQYKRYITAYIMTYPVAYNPATDGNLFAYVTAYAKDDSEKKEIHFVSSPLAGFNMESGHYYQLSSGTHLDDGLYPIELTATLLPWTAIVGGITTDLEK